MLKRLEHVLFSVRNASGLYNIERGKGYRPQRCQMSQELLTETVTLLFCFGNTVLIEFTWNCLEPVQVFTRDRSGTGPDRIRYWTCKTAGPVLDPFRTGSRTVPCKQKAYPVRFLDRFPKIGPDRPSVYTGPFWNRSGTDPKLDLLFCRSSIGSDPDRFQNGPV